MGSIVSMARKTDDTTLEKARRVVLADNFGPHLAAAGGRAASSCRRTTKMCSIPSTICARPSIGARRPSRPRHSTARVVRSILNDVKEQNKLMEFLKVRARPDLRRANRIRQNFPKSCSSATAKFTCASLEDSPPTQNVGYCLGTSTAGPRRRKEAWMRRSCRLRNESHRCSWLRDPPSKSTANPDSSRPH